MLTATSTFISYIYRLLNNLASEIIFLMAHFFSLLCVLADCRNMTTQQKQRIQVPDCLRDVLLEFSIAYLLEQPGDVIDYAVEFFTRLQENRKTPAVQSGDIPSPDESVMSQDEG